MERLKKERTVQRNSFNKSANHLTALLNQQDPSEATVQEIRATFHVLQQQQEGLRDVDLKLYELMLETDATEDAIIAETSTADEYIACFARLSVRHNDIVAERERENSSRVSAESQRHVAASQRRKFKLPKIELRKFGGDVKDWLTFWSQFEKIHVDDEIESGDKFQYLLQATIPGSRARELVESFPSTAANYEKVIASLKARFGRDELQVEVYVRELLKLVLNKAFLHQEIQLVSLYDKIETQLRALESLGVTTEKCAAMLFPLVESCLPEELIRVWQRSTYFSQNVNSVTKSRLDGLMAFLKNEVENEERVRMASEGFGKTARETRKKENSRTCVPTAAGLVNNILKCLFCDGTHNSEDCFKAQKMAVQDKQNVLRTKGACFVCLKLGHLSRKCKVQVRCHFCGKRHTTLLCPDIPKYQKKEGNSTDKADQSASKAEKALANRTSSHVFLQTLRVKVRSETQEREVRALIDTGSQRSYVLTTTAKEMGYPVKRHEKMIHALFGGTRSGEISHNCYDLRLASLDGEYACRLEAFDQENICDDVSTVFGGSWTEELKKLKISVSDVGDSSRIEVLLGADVAGKLLTGKRRLLRCGVVAVETMLGWTLMGKVPEEAPRTNSMMAVFSLFSKEMDVAELWRLDVLGISDPGERKTRKEIEQAVNEHFLETIKVDEDQRYEVRLPWLEGHPPLPTNFDLAKKRLDAVEKKLATQRIDADYQEVFEQWLEEGVIEKVPEDELRNLAHYLPHRPVIKESSLTTKIRPVFDASAHERNQPSLNVCLEKGPNLIEMIPSVLTRFRIARIGVAADIKKAFLQIGVHASDRDSLRFLWKDKEGNMCAYRHRRVVFGVCCSPYLLGMTIQYHLKKMLEDSSYSAATITKLMTGFYVDNCLTSVHSEEELDSFMTEASQLMAEGKFELRGWESSMSEYLEESATLSNVLGMEWDRKNDTLAIKHEDSFNTEKITKRQILSVAHQVYDPVGFTAPASLTPKLLLQKMWQKKTTWDEEVDEETKTVFCKWRSELHLLTEIKISRWFDYDPQEVNDVSMHTFCDASKDAYGAVIFLRVAKQSEVHVHLIQAKTRVAPLNRLTIPRLELLAATIGARLYDSIKEIFAEIKFESYFWSDSSTVLSWIRQEEEWAVFVWNRVEEIRALTKKDAWRHVPGSMNPADLLSRGCSAKHLLESRWWEGPDWLYEPPHTWEFVNNQESCDEDAINRERRKRLISSFLNGTSHDWHLTYFSKFSRVLRMIAWIFRFIHNARAHTDRRRGELNAEEIDAAEEFVLKLIQQESFEVNDKSIASLTPFCDERGLIRLRSRVSSREDDKNFRFPIVLPRKHYVVELLIREFHENMCHVGTQGLLNAIREKYWILGGRRAIRAVITKCVVCRRHSVTSMQAECPSLPLDRVRDAAVFEVVGIDFAGPVYLKTGKKAWVCLFTCAVYRAVHLELTTSLSTSSFLQALRRFVARRGRPKIVYTDNGTNFVGAENALKRLKWDQIVRDTSIRRISWRFNPPTAAWWGGWWERLIGLMKQLLKRVLGRAALSYEEFCTVLCDAEATMNSRPLTYVSNDPRELVPLTPLMFLQDLRESGVPDCDKVEGTDLDRRLQYRQRLRDELRPRFRIEYLGQLRQICKKKSGRAITLGEVVLIGNDSSKRLQWPLARVTELIPGKDGRIRLVRLKTTNGHMLRPIQRIYPLECIGSSPATGIDVLPLPRDSSDEEKESDEVPGVNKGNLPGQPAEVMCFSDKEEESDEVPGVERGNHSGRRAKVTRCGREVKTPLKLRD